MSHQMKYWKGLEKLQDIKILDYFYFKNFLDQINRYKPYDFSTTKKVNFTYRRRKGVGILYILAFIIRSFISF